MMTRRCFDEKVVGGDDEVRTGEDPPHRAADADYLS